MVSKAAYLSAVKAYLQSVLSDEPPYFPLSFQPRSVYARDLFAAIPSLSLDEVVRSHRASSIIGPPGSGKTRALRDLAWTYCLDAQRGLQAKRTAGVAMPVYVPLRHFCTSLEKNPSTWQELILPPVNNALSQHGCEFASLQEFVTFLGGHYFILFLDGLNELSGGDARIFLDIVSSISLNCRIVISSRIREYPSERVDYPVYQVRPLEFPKQVKSFIRTVGNHYGLSLSEGRKVYKACERSPILRQLATNPYLLCQLCFAASLHSGSLPKGKAALLRFIERSMIQNQGRIRLVDAELALCRLAFNMHQSRVLSITVSEAISCLNQLGVQQLYPKDLIKKMTEARLLFQRRATSDSLNDTDQDILEYSHQIFQEFFAGTYVLQNKLKPCLALPQAQKKLKSTVLSHARSLWDWEVLSIAVASLAEFDFDSALRTIQLTCRRNCCLAALILSEVPDPQLNEDDERLTLLRQSVLKKLEGRLKIWAFVLPHLYKWLPLLTVMPVFIGLLILVRIPESRPLGEILANTPWGITLQLLFACVLGLCISAAYFRFLRLVYSYLDEIIFDKVVRQLIASLEVLRHHGGEERLRELYLRTECNPYMGDRMRSWLSSAAPIPMGRIPYVLAHLPRGLRLALIHKLADSPREDSVPQLLRLLSDLKAPERERDAVVGALNRILRKLGRDDLLFKHIIDSLCQHLRVEPSEKLKKKIRHVIEQPGTDEIIPDIWEFLREFLRKIRVIKWQLVGLLVLVALAVFVSTPRTPAFIDIKEIIILVVAFDQTFRIIYKIWRKSH